MKIAIHQPYFLPWLGYFDKIRRVNVFVFMDEVKFRKRFYHDRTKIIDMNSSISFASLKCKDTSFSSINNKEIDQIYFNNAIRTIKDSYCKASYFDQNFEWIEDLLIKSFNPNSLAKTNISIIKGIAYKLEISIPMFSNLSELSVSSEPTDRIIEICRIYNCSTLILGTGKSKEVHDINKIGRSGIEIKYIDFLSIHPTYSQSRRRKLEFTHGLSIVDVIFNCGLTKTREFLLP